jgi:hypothetical protein
MDRRAEGVGGEGGMMRTCRVAFTSSRQRQVFGMGEVSIASRGTSMDVAARWSREGRMGLEKDCPRPRAAWAWSMMGCIDGC